MYKRTPTVPYEQVNYTAWLHESERDEEKTKDREQKIGIKKNKQTYKMRMEMIKQLQRDCSKNKVKSIIQLVCCLFISVWVYAIPIRIW